GALGYDFLESRNIPHFIPQFRLGCHGFGWHRAALCLQETEDSDEIWYAVGRGETKEWWPGTGLNRRRRPFQGRALPLSYLASVKTFRCNLLRGFRHGRRVRVSQGTLAAA